MPSSWYCRTRCAARLVPGAKALKRAGIYDWKAKTGKHVRFHDLRRTAISLMRDLGVTEGDISATTGHSIAVMRAVYSHPLPTERRGGTDAIAAALRAAVSRASY